MLKGNNKLFLAVAEYTDKSTQSTLAQSENTGNEIPIEFTVYYMYTRVAIVTVATANNLVVHTLPTHRLGLKT